VEVGVEEVEEEFELEAELEGRGEVQVMEGMV